ncbi:MAG: hypothetical protein EA424_01385 [Planctomycetaceae bacterium]|nr:MAG: hypothetical protein EA424_01385 [Planctomycetaceae bacterium]
MCKTRTEFSSVCVSSVATILIGLLGPGGTMGLLVRATAMEPAGIQWGESPLTVDFDRTPLGEYTESHARQDWPGLQWFAFRGRGTIVEDALGRAKRSLRIAYPEDSVGPGQGGGQFRVQLPPREEYFLSYRVKFEEDFDFRLGGKLPGLCGGRANTGGNRPTGDGWSARYMWGREGHLRVYLYHMNQRSKYGDSLSLNVHAVPGEWHQLTQRIKVNHPERSDGELQVWFDGQQVLFRDDIQYRNIDNAQVDTFYFSTFHGGNSDQWAPQHDSYARFDAFRIRARR